MKPTTALPPGIPMDIDALRAGDLRNLCYQCKQPGHHKHECPHQYDVRFMTCVEDFEDKMNEITLKRDKAVLEKVSKPSDDFRTSDE